MNVSLPYLRPNHGLQETRKQVAIKTVNRSGLSPKLFDNLQGEIDILKNLSHRHITRLLDVIVSPLHSPQPCVDRIR